MSDPNGKDVELLDLEQIEMLLETGGEEAVELMDELIELYISECLVKFKEIENALLPSSAVDCKAIARHAHAVAGSSANIGAKRMWHIAKSIELSLDNGEELQARQQYGKLRETFDCTIESIRSASA